MAGKIIFFTLFLAFFSIFFIIWPAEAKEHFDIEPRLRADYNSYIEEGLCRLENKDYYSALYCFYQAQGLVPELPDSYINLAAVYMQKKDFIEADKNLKKAERLIPPQYSQKNVLFYNMGLSANLQGQHQEAYYLYQKALEEDPYTPNALYAQAEIKKAEGELQDALDRFLLAALIFREKGNFSMARVAGEWIAQINAADPSLGIDLMQSSKENFDRGKFIYSALLLEEFLRQNPQDPQAHYRLGLVYAQAKKYHKAIDKFETAIEYEKDFIQAYLNAGSAYGSIQEYDRALENFKKALSLEKDNPNIHYNLAMVYSALGNHRSAGKHIKQAERLASKKGDLSLLRRIESLGQ